MAKTKRIGTAATGGDTPVAEHERKRAQEQLQTQADILAQLTDAVVATDTEHRVTYLNRAAQDRYEVVHAEAVGRPLSALYSCRWVKPEDEARALRALEERGHWCGENVHVARSGHEISVESTVSVLRNGRGEKVGFLATIRDLTERKRAQVLLLEKAVAERTAELDKRVSTLESIGVVISHDLRFPLGSLRLFAAKMEEACARNEWDNAREFLRQITVRAERMDTLLTDALDYLRMSSRQNFEPVDTWAVLKRILDSPELKPHKAHIRVEGNLPVVLASEDHLAKCFWCLLENAAKFVKPGQVPDIKVWAEEHDGWARFWVQDNGIGIAKDFLPRVWDMLSRGNTDYEGIGNGLAVVRRSIHWMNGKVGVESEEGKGSRFWLEVQSTGVWS